MAGALAFDIITGATLIQGGCADEDWHPTCDTLARNTTTATRAAAARPTKRTIPHQTLAALKTRGWITSTPPDGS